MNKGDMSPWVVVTIIIIAVVLGLFLVITYEANLKEKIDKIVEDSRDKIEIETGSPTSCQDSDGGHNYFVEGSAETRDETLEDSCESGVLTEYWCNREEVEAETYVCPKGCTGNACTGGSLILEECVDDDGGVNYFTYGVVTMLGESYADSCIKLQGIDILVKEHLCSKTEDNPVEVKSFIYQCPEGCENGSCIYGG